MGVVVVCAKEKALGMEAAEMKVSQSVVTNETGEAECVREQDPARSKSETREVEPEQKAVVY